MYRIATWNLERPVRRRQKTTLVLDKIIQMNPDLIVLTESSTAVELPDYNFLHSEPFYHRADEYWVSIASKWPISRSIKTFNINRTVCALVEAPFGEIIIYGTIIPYHMAGVNGSRYENRGYRAWQWHYEDIAKQAADWQRIKESYPEAPLLVLGDFNQTREEKGKGYGTLKGRELLGNHLKELDLKCVTEFNLGNVGLLSPHPKTGKVRRNIDHIVSSDPWLKNIEDFRIGAWNHFTEDGKNMSDHNAVYFDFIP